MSVPAMETKRPIRCSENEEIAQYLWNKRQEMAGPSGLSENLDLTLTNAYRNICGSKTHIKTIKDLSQIKGVGKWILRLMKGFFPSTEDSPSKIATAIAKKTKGPKRYMPQKNSVAYALLITLYREMVNGVSFMKKQELIDAAEASGLSRAAIRPDKATGKPGSFVSSPRDWYTGWSCMKTLVSKGLVVKSSCPAKYKLTQEGIEAARDCILRSGLADLAETLNTAGGSQNSLGGGQVLDVSHVVSVDNEAAIPSSDLSCQLKSNAIDQNLGCSLVDSSESDSAEFCEKQYPSALTACTTSSSRDNAKIFSSGDTPCCQVLSSSNSAPSLFTIRNCNSSDLSLHKLSGVDAEDGGENILAMPPRGSGEKFEEAYAVVLILDDRERFGSRSKKIVDILRSQFNILVEVRRLPIGDGIWIVRHRQSYSEYVLDFIVERKRVDDLCSSIRDNRYRDQKLRLQRCGLQKLIYLVEGDPNPMDAAESLRTACFTTEILEGFDVQRTTGFTETVKKYGYLTQSIFLYYCAHFSSNNTRSSRICPSFGEFVKKCQDLEKMTVSDVFALQLMQVPQVTEDIALAVIDLYPTILSLARAYSRLEGDAHAQEEMLKNQSKMVSGGASRNIFKLVWG